MEPNYIYATPKQAVQWHTSKPSGKPEATVKQNAAVEGEPQAKVTGRGLLTLFLLLLFILSFIDAIAQTSQHKSITYKAISPAQDHYSNIAAIEAKSKNTALDTVAFPAKDFHRGAYLKMRTVYLDVPVEKFRIKPYPANSSAQTRAELDFLLQLQLKRTATDIALTDTMAMVYYDPYTVNPANPDYSRNANSLFYVGRNLGAWFNPKQLPITSQVLQNVIQDATYYFFSLKARFNRARPYHLEPALQHLEAPGHASYPSGHSSASHVHAYLLSHILPEYKEQFLGNAYDMAFSREIRGVHYPSDSEAGRAFAEQFVALLLKSKKFEKDYAAMKAEITRVKSQNQLSHK